MVYDDYVEYDDDMEDDDYAVCHDCPNCNKVWRESPMGDGAIEWWDRTPIQEKGLIDIDGNKIEYETYPEGLCPHCGEQTIDGRRKGPLVEKDLEGKELDYEDFKCQVCGSKEMVFKPGRFPEEGTLICDSCNSYNFIEMDNQPYYQNITRLSYREDLQTKEFNENFEEIAKIILDSKATPIQSSF